MDKQTRVLQKWEAHVRELQAGPNPIHNPAVDAMAAWAGAWVHMSRRGCLGDAGQGMSVANVAGQLLQRDLEVPGSHPACPSSVSCAGISWKARQAMKRSSPSHVHAIEAPILAFVQQVCTGAEQRPVVVGGHAAVALWSCACCPPDS